MIKHTIVDKSLRRLTDHFGARVAIPPPAAAADLARLEALAGPLPREYVLFLSTCNGLRVAAVEDGDGHRLWSVQEVLSTCGRPQVPAVPYGFVPLGEHADGTTDWLVLVADHALHGAVLRWAPGQHGEEIVASSFAHYLDNWTRYLTETFDRRGRRVADHASVAFDGAYCAKADADIAKLRRRRGVRALIAELELRACAGEDFE